MQQDNSKIEKRYDLQQKNTRIKNIYDLPLKDFMTGKWLKCLDFVYDYDKVEIRYVDNDLRLVLYKKIN